jgi:uncharacterized protein YjbI with pentapeptide repeats
MTDGEPSRQRAGDGGPRRRARPSLWLRGVVDLGKWVRGSPTIKTAVAVAEVLGKLAIFLTIVTYLTEGPARQKAKEFQAWQVINGARSGDGGRILALHDLIVDHVDLSHIDLSRAALDNGDFRGGLFYSADFTQATLNNTDFSCAPRRRWFPPKFTDCARKSRLSRAVFTGVNLWRIRFDRATMQYFVFPDPVGEVYQVSFRGSVIQDTSLHDGMFNGVSFVGARLERVALRDMQWSKPSEGAAGLTDLTDAVLDRVTFDGHPLREADMAGAILCRTRIDGRISNRDCRLGKTGG